MATFLANAANQKKVFVPSTFNVSKIMKSLQLQKTDLLVCDAELYSMEPPEDQVESLKEMTAGIEKVVVASTDGSSADSTIFGSATTLDAYSL